MFHSFLIESQVIVFLFDFFFFYPRNDDYYYRKFFVKKLIQWNVENIVRVIIKQMNLILVLNSL